MKPERPYLDYLEDILDAIEKIRNFTRNMNADQFIRDTKTASRKTSRPGPNTTGHDTMTR